MKKCLCYTCPLVNTLTCISCAHHGTKALMLKQHYKRIGGLGGVAGNREGKAAGGRKSGEVRRAKRDAAR